MFSIRVMKFIGFLALSPLLMACEVTVYSGSEGHQAAIDAGMPTIESIDRSAETARAEGRLREPKPIIAFGGKENLFECLQRLTAVSQLTAANDGSLIQGGNCSFGKPTVAFNAFSADFLETRTHIFPIIRIDVLSDSAERYSHDGMFSRRDWRVERRIGPNACTRRQVATYGGCLIADSCEEQLRYKPFFGAGAGYIRRTAQCRNLS